MTDYLNRYDSMFQWYAGQHGLDWRDLKAQALEESRLNPKACSPAGAEGIAQAMPATWREVMGDADPFNPESSICFQAIYLRRLLDRYGREMTLALAAYNWGMGNLGKCLRAFPDDWRDHLPLETRQYLSRIAATRLRLG